MAGARECWGSTFQLLFQFHRCADLQRRHTHPLEFGTANFQCLGRVGPLGA